MKLTLFFSFLLLLSLAGCASKVKNAVNDIKYSAWEKVGVEKRDLFKREVSNVKGNQEDSGEAFKDALTRLQEVYAFDGGNLEREYNKLNNSYKDAKDGAGDVSSSIKKLDTVANDLFSEWKTEIDEISSSDLRRKSSEQLQTTRSRYRILHERLTNAEKKMGPVLVKLKDQVTYLKHNLNAKAIGGLKSEGDKIQIDIEKLIKEMNSASAEADEFIKTL